MLDKIHVVTVFENGFIRVLIYLDGSIEVVQSGTTIPLSTETVDRVIAERKREMLRKFKVTE
jgi:hypothetical protein